MERVSVMLCWTFSGMALEKDKDGIHDIEGEEVPFILFDIKIGILKSRSKGFHFQVLGLEESFCIPHITLLMTKSFERERAKEATEKHGYLIMKARKISPDLTAQPTRTNAFSLLHTRSFD